MRKCAYISIVGAPNAGKSTLLNSIMGKKLSIVSPKVQTTRVIINGVKNIDESQLIFIDTPGIFSPKHNLEKLIVKHAWSGVRDADFIILLVDGTKPVTENLNHIIRSLAKKQKQIILAINKIDAVKQKDTLLPLIEELNKLIKVNETFLISAKKNERVKDLVNYLKNLAPEGEWHYGMDDIETVPQKFMAAELTREELFLNLNKELPYSLVVLTEQLEELNNGDYKIHQVVLVSKDSHKKMIIGKNASNIKKISQRARQQISKCFSRKVHLFLHVKIKANWLNDPKQYIDREEF